MQNDSELPVNLSQFRGELDQLRQGQAELQNYFETYLFNRQIHHLTQPTIITAMLESVVIMFEVSLVDITDQKGDHGVGRNRKGTVSPQDHKIRTAQDWLAILFRQMTHIGWKNLKEVYPWFTQYRFEDAGLTLTALRTNIKHPARQTWLALWADVLQRGRVMGANVTYAEAEFDLVRHMIPNSL